MLPDRDVAALLLLLGTTHPQPLPFREGSVFRKGSVVGEGSVSKEARCLFVGRATSTMLACCGQSTL